jgi:uncharacterized short protein YbdD (DUF466 family)
MKRLLSRVRVGLAAFWKGLREWSGDAAYEKYAEAVTRSGARASLTPEEFYVEQLNRKYSRPSRCC